MPRKVATANKVRGFLQSEIITLLEVARRALNDAEFFDEMAVALDICDSDMIALRDKLQAYMDNR